MDMVVNASKSCCVRTGPRSNVVQSAVLPFVCRLVIILYGWTNDGTSEYILYVHVCSSDLLTRQRNLSIGPLIHYL